jgi:putative membrane protein
VTDANPVQPQPREPEPQPSSLSSQPSSPSSQPSSLSSQPSSLSSQPSSLSSSKGGNGNGNGNGTGLADGEWHRLHPATPLLRGGIAFVAILGVIIVNLRDVVINIVIGNNEDDPFTYVLENGYAGLLVLAIIGGLLITIAFFWVSWRMHTFRITEELVEVRSGVLFRTHRRGRLDRIQGINIVRPFLARLFGAAKLEINVAGQDANVPLSYLGSAQADALRREILRLASGTQVAQGAEQVAEGQSGKLIQRRVDELLAPELDRNAAPPQSIVEMSPVRLIGSTLLSGTTLGLIVIVAAIIVSTTVTGSIYFLFGFVPAAIGMASYTVSRVTKSLRYSIASTPDGIRVGYGLLSTSNETLPPGRIHAVMVSQPLLWRPAGWWEIKLNRASHSSTKGAAGQANTTILPVGSIDDVKKVLELVLPGVVDAEALALLERGLTSKGGDDGFTNSPPRAAWIRWFSWRRNGFAITPDAVLLRRGAIWRELIAVPQARMQSVSYRQGPLLRAMRLAIVRMHTVAGPVTARLGAIDADVGWSFFEEVAHEAITAAERDTTHRWRQAEGGAPA